eukprot:gene25546-11281_t
MINSNTKVVVTADSTSRGEKPIKLKAIVDAALAKCEAEGLYAKCVVYERHNRDVAMTSGRDVWYQDAVADVSDECPIEWMEAEESLFMLYTSGSTGKPKGLLHTTG